MLIYAHGFRVLKINLLPSTRMCNLAMHLYNRRIAIIKATKNTSWRVLIFSFDFLIMSFTRVIVGCDNVFCFFSTNTATNGHAFPSILYCLRCVLPSTLVFLWKQFQISHYPAVNSAPWNVQKNALTDRLISNILMLMPAWMISKSLRLQYSYEQSSQCGHLRCFIYELPCYDSTIHNDGKY